MATPEAWRRQLNRWGRKVEDVLTDIPVELAIETRRRIAIRTPKRTGRAAGSWNASVGTPDYTTQPPTFNNVTGSVEAGRVNLSGYSLGRTIYVSNGIPYISDLNHGSSRQAPAGFVEATAQEVHVALPEIVRRVRGRHGI